jgi:archaellum component FlaC
MDPQSITTGVTSIIETIDQLTITISSFVKQIRDARNDLDAIMRELVSLKIVLELLADDLSGSDQGPLPESLTKQIRGILDGCETVITHIKETLAKFQGNSLVVKRQWVTSGRPDMDKLKPSLEAHNTALGIALDMMSL